ncbi:unnamed protein product [Euphydryas editha]|uniref:Insulin-like domain-containing protein n=1 Tax=Euphydryas editha TaxID=104508 RepID=A0AAU9UEN6_EUPED|nr:unnamed protein product [Euphydryas editha]
MKTSTVLVLFVVSCLAVASSQGDRQVYCGRRLATALAVLCDYNLIKRSETHRGMTQENLIWPWINTHRAHSLGRSKRQVASECCDKPCSIDELMSYCSN